MRAGLLMLVMAGWMGGCMTRERSTGYRGSPSGKEVKDLPGGSIPNVVPGSPSSGGGGRGDSGGAGGKTGSDPGGNQGTSHIVGSSTGLHLMLRTTGCALMWSEAPLLALPPSTCGLAGARVR